MLANISHRRLNALIVMVGLLLVFCVWLLASALARHVSEGFTTDTTRSHLERVEFDRALQAGEGSFANLATSHDAAARPTPVRALALYPIHRQRPD